MSGKPLWFREDRGDLWTHSVRVVVVPEFAHFAVDYYDVIETHSNVLHSDFDNAVATVLDEIFIENINSIHAVGMVHSWVAQKTLKRDILRVFTRDIGSYT